MIDIKMDITQIKTIDELHDFLKKAFGFPDFYGSNAHALIDCWSSLRFPEDKMLNISLKKDEQILIKIRKYGLEQSKSKIVLEELFYAISSVNSWYEMKKQTPPIIVMLLAD